MLPEFRNEPFTDFSNPDNVKRMEEALARAGMKSDWPSEPEDIGGVLIHVLAKQLLNASRQRQMRLRLEPRLSTRRAFLQTAMLAAAGL